MSFVSLQNCRNNFAAGPSDGGKQGNSLLRYPLTFRLRPTAALILHGDIKKNYPSLLSGYFYWFAMMVISTSSMTERTTSMTEKNKINDRENKHL